MVKKRVLQGYHGSTRFYAHPAADVYPCSRAPAASVVRRSFSVIRPEYPGEMIRRVISHQRRNLVDAPVCIQKVFLRLLHFQVADNGRITASRHFFYTSGQICHRVMKFRRYVGKCSGLIIFLQIVKHRCEVRIHKISRKLV